MDILALFGQVGQVFAGIAGQIGGLFAGFAHPLDVLRSGDMVLASLIAFVAGVVSFVSPCILPVVPGYLSVLATEGKRSVWGAVLFVLGFSGVYVAGGAFFGTVGHFFLRWNDLLIRLLGVVVILFGIAHLVKLRFLQRGLFAPLAARAGSVLYAPILGIAFGFSWVPCLGPTLVAIQSLSFASASAGRGAFLTFLYTLGLGVPFILAAGGWAFVARILGLFRLYAGVFYTVGGLMLIAVGLLMLLGFWTGIMSYFAWLLPNGVLL